jgi:hypothetical protein
MAAKNGATFAARTAPLRWLLLAIPPTDCWFDVPQGPCQNNDCQGQVAQRPSVLVALSWLAAAYLASCLLFDVGRARDARYDWPWIFRRVAPSTIRPRNAIASGGRSSLGGKTSPNVWQRVARLEDTARAERKRTPEGDRGEPPATIHPSRRG